MRCKNILQTIGNTPLVLIKESKDKKYRLWAKVESFNPSGSIKARVANYIIEEAIKSKLVNKRTIIIEATSGNTGIGLAMVCAVKKLKLIVTMPNNMSQERIDILKAYGAKVILTDMSQGMEGAKNKAIELCSVFKNSFMPSQFTNINNSLIHYLTTGKEILDDLGEIDCLVAGIGTSGTIMGISKYLKEKKDVHIVGVEPFSSPLLSKGKIGIHKIQGIGANFIPPLLNKKYLDEIMLVKDKSAIIYTKKLVKENGLFVGLSSGAVYKAALDIYNNKKFHDIVAVFPDDGQKYLSLKIW